VTIPNGAISTVPVVSSLLPPDDRETTDLTDFENGGIGLNDPSEGLNYQVWSLTYSSPDVIVTPDSGGDITLFSFTGITQISLAFDQNMNPFVAYVRDGDAWYWWYDSLTEEQIHTQLNVLDTTPRCCLDDKRVSQLPKSDIILGYIREKTLYYRQQRDRYLVEYPLITGDNVNKLNKIAMGVNLRLHFEYYSA
jgi:hypothetical protein